MRLSVPTNWDDALLDALAGLPVGDLYGQIDLDPAGGGRPRFLQARVDRAQAAAHIRKARDRGVEFTYLMNAPCLDNREYQASFRSTLLDHLRWARDAGATGVTVSIPLVAEVIKESLPDLWVKISVIAHVGSVARLRAWAALGADEVTLDFNVNRDLDLLRVLRGAVGCELSLLVNDLCLLDCPYRHYHYAVAGHASQAGHSSGGKVIDYCFLSCHRRKLLEPVELLRSPWIRPEDLGTYEALGFERFKIAGRTKTCAQIARMARAWGERRSPPNLLDVLEGTSRDTSTLGYAAVRALAEHAPGLLGRGLAARAAAPGWLPWPGASHFAEVLADVPPRLREDLVRVYLLLMQLSEIVVLDARHLDGFLEGFHGRRCGAACGACDHCGQWARRALRVDEVRAMEVARALEDVLRAVVAGDGLFGA